MKLLLSAAICSFVALAACGGDGTNPFMDDTGTGTDPDIPVNPVDPTDPIIPDDGFNIGTGGVPPQVDGEPSAPNRSVVRYEERNENGGGRAEIFTYIADGDRFSVDNLAFDGDEPYSRESDEFLASLGPNNSYAVYEAEQVVPDFLDLDPIDQIVPYRAIVGISKATVEDAPRTSFAIVRTGGYVDYGFGGFVYQRAGGVVMPTTGQARFDGDYAGMRIYNGRGGMDYVEGNMWMALDFDDPTDAVAGVRGSIFDRVAFDVNGVPITSTGNNERTPDGVLPLPNVSFVLNGDQGNVSADGELNGGLISSYLNASGNTVDHEAGTYFAILAGDTTTPDGGEIVGVVVLNSTDPRFGGSEAQETGGFILYRDDAATPIP
jgi:hypothetical protein